MNNNDIIRRIRYALSLNDAKMIEIFSQADREVTREEISGWLKKDDDADQVGLYDNQLAIFLDGLIFYRRGKREGVVVKPEKKLNNNIILRKLKIALDFKDIDMLEIFSLADMRISKHELSAFFRKPTQSQFRPCKDQFLRSFLHGLQLKYRGTK